MLVSVRIFAQLAVLIALAMLPAALVAGTYGEEEVLAVFVVSALLIGFFSGTLAFALRKEDQRMRRREALSIAVLVWFGFPALAALPFSAAGFSMLEAYFQAVSAFTTTGASLARNAASLPRGLVFWQALLQWLGGLATLMTIILLLAPTGVGGLPTTLLRMIEHVRPTAVARTRTVMGGILPLYGGMTLACVLLLLGANVPAFDALCLAFSTVSTGGLTPRDGGLSGYGSALVEPVLMVFMLYGATSILWHRMIVGGETRLLQRHRESVLVLIVSFALGLVYAYHGVLTGTQAGQALREGLFMGASIVSTTGFESRVGLLASAPFALVVMLTIAGGGSFSTAGGLKLYRLGAMLTQCARQLQGLVYPHAVLTRRFGSHDFDEGLMSSVWSYFALFLLSLAGLTAVVAWSHPAAEGAFLAALAALSNAGPIYTLAWPDAGGWPSYAEFSPFAKAALLLGMILGRLELVSFLSVLLALRRTI